MSSQRSERGTSASSSDGSARRFARTSHFVAVFPQAQDLSDDLCLLRGRNDEYTVIQIVDLPVVSRGSQR
jgi:hypothetical protein